MLGSFEPSRMMMTIVAVRSIRLLPAETACQLPGVAVAHLI
jgi:hypothetical protein